MRMTLEDIRKEYSLARAALREDRIILNLYTIAAVYAPNRSLRRQALKYVAIRFDLYKRSLQKSLALRKLYYAAKEGEREAVTLAS